MENFLNSLNDSLYKVMIWFDKHIWDLICGWVAASLCYFLEIKGAVNVMLIIIAADLIFGIIASTCIRGERFSMKKFFIAIGRAFVFTAFVSMLYALDKETHQELTASYFIATWLISGGYIWSFLTNAGDIFGGGAIFQLLKSFFRKQFQEKTGVDISESEAKHGISGN